MPNEQGMSKRQAMREKRVREQQRNRWISIGLVTLGVLVIFGLFLGPTINEMLHPYNPTVPTPRSLPDVNDNSLGKADAPITITEYSDFQCPYCRQFHEKTEDQLIQDFVTTGQVRFVYRSFGGFIGAESQASAEAAYCAGDQGKFWEMHDILFANQTGENVGAFSNARLSTFAQKIGLDMTQYNSCMSSGKFASRATQDGTDGAAAGVKATPSFILSYVVNGQTKTQLIEGAQDISTFQSDINAALTEMGIK